MKEELKFEILIMLCICFSAYLFEKLITISVISPLLLYGGVIGIALSLFVCALFTTMSVNTISDHPEVRRNTRILYGFLSLVSIMALLILLAFEVDAMVFWTTTCILWYFTCIIRVAMFWKWF